MRQDVDEEVKSAMNVSGAVYGEARVLVLQCLWDYVRAGLQEILLSPYLPASCAFLTHVMLCAPFLALDALGSVCQTVRSWRIDAGSGPPPPLWRWCDCFWTVLYRYLTTVIPVTALFQAARSPTLPEHAPTCWQLFVEVFACFLLFDTLFFIWHFSMHRWAVYTGLNLDSSVSTDAALPVWILGFFQMRVLFLQGNFGKGKITLLYLSNSF